MRRGLFAGASALAMLVGAVGSAQAAAYTYVGVAQGYTVATTGLYDIIVDGAQGGNTTNTAKNQGGLGARVSGAFLLSAGQTLAIVVGQQGISGYHAGGGGGGSFVYLTGAPHPLAVAGGGGGAGNFPGNIGGYGLAGTAGGNGFGSGGGAGGTNGSGGSAGQESAGYASGAGGAGWKSNGGPSSGKGEASGGDGPPSFARGGGSYNGGFGGGGGAGSYSGGGGGGYSGGGGGFTIEGFGAGGGGSYLGASALDPVLTADVRSGNGYVSIAPATASSVPEPAGAALLASALAGIGLLRRRRS